VPGNLSVGDLVQLDAAMCNHVVRVLRLGAGSPLVFFNGAGGEFSAVLEQVERRGGGTARVEGFSPREAESPLSVVLAQGIPKGERMDYVVQKAVELGVSAIQPLFTERSIVHLQGSRLSARLRHWHGIVTSACEQSGRNRVPDFLAPRYLDAWLGGIAPFGEKLVLDPGAEAGLSAMVRPAMPVTLLIGPEGGLSDAEIDRAQAHGFGRLRLGPRVMRTETAGLAMLAALQVLWGDLG
jgi:16S rRNA (uracil1498-N3)-methyltransferase